MPFLAFEEEEETRVAAVAVLEDVARTTSHKIIQVAATTIKPLTLEFHKIIIITKKDQQDTKLKKPVKFVVE